MGKLKTATCDKCGKPIKRHDANRVTSKVRTLLGFRYVIQHLACTQEEK